MFGKKKEKEECIRICLNGVEIYRGTMTDLPLKEEIILGKSDEFFNDPNPFGTGMQPFREWIR